MNWRVGAAVLTLGAAVLSGNAPMTAQGPALDVTARRVDRARLMRNVVALSSPGFEGRSTGSPGAARARAWLVAEFRTAGVTPAGTEEFLQPFTVPTGVVTRNGDASPTLSGRSAANVLGRIAGRDTRATSIVVMAHFDHLGIRNGVLYPGADDNASGVAVLLAAARDFVTNPPRHPMLFAALDAEEIGFRGARTLIDSPLLSRQSIALAINVDMVSRSSRNEIFASGTYHTPWLAPLLRDVQMRSAVTIRLGHDRPAAIAAGLKDWTRSSDHSPFHDAGIPFVYFGVEDHGDYHKPSDTADRIDPRFFGDTADMIVEALRTLDVRVD